MRLGRDDALDGVKSVLSGLSWPLAAVMAVTLRSCSVPGQEGSPKPSAQFGPAWPAKFRRHSRPATSERVTFGRWRQPGMSTCHPLETFGVAPGKVSNGAKPEAADLQHELPFSAGSRPRGTIFRLPHPTQCRPPRRYRVSAHAPSRCFSASGAARALARSSCAS